MSDDPRTPPEDSLSFRRGGPAAVFAVEVRGPRDAVVVMDVDHRDEPGMAWSPAGSLSVLGPGKSVIRVSDLKEELRLRCSVVGNLGPDPVEVRVLPPEWLSC